MGKDLSIIIINYKTPDLTIRCIESVYATTKCNFEIIVVDNASCDDSKDRIYSQFPQVVWIQNEENVGFGRANNIGVANARGSYLLLLNSDMVVTENAIDHCLVVVKNNATIGVLGCKLVNEDGSLQNSVYHDVVSYKSLMNQNVVFVKIFGEKSYRDKIVAIMGSFMIVSKELYKEIGGFDPDFFMYFEEIDMCRRIIEKGYSINYDDAVYAYHKHGASSPNNKKRLRQVYASQMLMVFKHKGFFGYLLYNLLLVNNLALNAVVSLFRKQYRKGVKDVFNAYICNVLENISIPFLYRRKMGNGKRMLKVK